VSCTKRSIYLRQPGDSTRFSVGFIELHVGDEEDYVRIRMQCRE
jgi:hypothetical protein